MFNRFIILFLLLLFFSVPAWGGQSQPEKTQKQPLADTSPSVQQQEQPPNQEAVSTSPSDQPPSEDDTEEESSDLDDEHG